MSKNWADIFTKLRKKSREKNPRQFSEALFWKTREYLNEEEVPHNLPDKKSQLIGSLKDYVEETLENDPKLDGSIPFKGGEVGLQSKSYNLEYPTDLEFIDIDQYELGHLAETRPVSPRVLYIGSSLSGNHQSDLFQKMLKAMDLKDSDQAWFFYDDDLNTNNLICICYHLRPQFIITLGAKATNDLLGKKERLSKVHGKFFPKEIKFRKGDVLEYEMMPLFHPDFLHINPNMKRSAWVDLQALQKKLN